jgi:hypothetical protein
MLYCTVLYCTIKCCALSPRMSPIATPATDDLSGTPASSIARQHPHTVAMLQRRDEEKRERGRKGGKAKERGRKEEKGGGVNEDVDRAGRWLRWR